MNHSGLAVSTNRSISRRISLVVPTNAKCTFGMKMVLGKGDRVEAQVLRHAGEFRDLGEHFLPGPSVAGNRSQAFAFFQRRGQSGVNKKHEFHTGLSSPGAP